MIVNFLAPQSLWERPWRPSIQGEEHLDENALARILYMAFSYNMKFLLLQSRLVSTRRTFVSCELAM
jgi:hypothetical protein